MKNDEISKIVIDTAVEVSVLNKSKVKLSTMLVKDLRMDSLDLIEFSLELECKLEENDVFIEIDLYMINKDQSIYEIIKFIKLKILH